ncbi:hypothetical protein AB1Y20_023080 [Prymnesium parvum]|uniref:Mitochondrial splicing suppressor 51-like C-terminal domain-containing protein n=1 Tax=Prymnesium parvum TaxID=97485 RepID=A0AB34JDD1_PRYPA
MRPAVGRLPVRTVEVHGMQLRILQHFFDTPPSLCPRRLTPPPLTTFHRRLTPPPLTTFHRRLTPPPLTTFHRRLTPPPLTTFHRRLTPPPLTTFHRRLTPPPHPAASHHLSPPPHPAASHRRLTPPPHPAASRRLTPPPLAASPRRLSPPHLAASRRLTSPPLATFHRRLSPPPLTAASHRRLSPPPLTAASAPQVWPTAHRMLRRMDETVLEQLRRAAAERARPLRVLELGSGTGIAGLGVALRLGRAASVVLTDPELAVNYAEAEAGTSLDLLRANVALNQPALEAAGAQVEARALEWADAAHARELRRACLPEGGEFDLVLGSELLYDSDHYAPLLAVLAAFVRSEATVAVLGYTHRSGSEARFLKQAAERFAVETEEFPRSEASAPWALSTLRYAPPPPPQTRESDRCGQQAGGARRRGYCSAAGPAPTAEQIDRMIAPPLHLTPHEQLELARSDDEQRGRRPLSLPAANSKGEVDYTSWGDYLLGRGWGEDNDLTDRLLVQSITGALSCPLTAYASCVLFGLDTRESLCLHVVGAASSNEGALLRSGWAWEELSALLPYTEVHLCLVGPALLEATGEMQQLTNQLTVECHAVDYVAWRTRRTSRAEVPAPDAVICFNSGCGTDEDAWGGAMDLILNERSPLVCTSFDEMDAEKDDRFLVARGAHFTRSTERNSFASTLPELRTGRQGEAVLSIAQRYGIELPPRIGYSNALWRAIQGKD